MNESVSLNLMLGSLLAGLPLLIASIANRFGSTISIPDELGLLTLSTLMLLSGVMLRLRSTTIMGGSLLALQLAMLLTFAGWQAQLAIGVYLSIGGGAIFLLGPRARDLPRTPAHAAGEDPQPRRRVPRAGVEVGRRVPLDYARGRQGAGCRVQRPERSMIVGLTRCAAIGHPTAQYPVRQGGADETNKKKGSVPLSPARGSGFSDRSRR